MTAEIIYTKNAPTPIGPYSQALKLDNGFIFISGQIALDPKTSSLIGGDVKEQTVQVFENIKAILLQCGCSLNNVIKTTVYLKNMDEFSDMNEVYSMYFTETKPVRTTIEVSRLPKNALIEIEALAVI